MGACHEHQKPIQPESNPTCSKYQRRSAIGCADVGGASVALQERCDLYLSTFCGFVGNAIILNICFRPIAVLCDDAWEYPRQNADHHMESIRFAMFTNTS